MIYQPRPEVCYSWTATPEQVGLRSHFDRLQLIDPARYADYEQFQLERIRSLSNGAG